MAIPPQNVPHFLIGSGERMTEETKYVTGPKPPKSLPYTPAAAAERLQPRVAKTIRAVNALPDNARPNGEAVAMVTMHPEFLAKTLFPASLFGAVGIRAIGSRARRIIPEQWSESPKKKQRRSNEAETIELYVAGSPEDFERWGSGLSMGSEYLRGFDELPRIEDVRPLEALDPSGRIRLPEEDGAMLLLEAAIHVPEDNVERILAAFRNFASTLAEIMDDVALDVPGIIFVPVRIARSNINKLAQFAFLRSLRPVAKLRALPTPRLTRSMGSAFTLPVMKPLNPSIRVAVLDGGLPDAHGLPFVSHYTAPGATQPSSGFLEHGMAVTGALMWGSLHEAGKIGMPYASVDHFRVLDAEDALLRDVHAYRVLKRVKDVIETGSHDIFNLSLGPDVTVDDDDVHPWTSTLDALCSDGMRLIVAAAGNNGQRPAPLCRIQSPGDGVNCLCVGASDHPAAGWKRAGYSAKGPGRRPGVTKPDVVAFGGGDSVPFKVVRKREVGYALDSDSGTSFAAPLVTRAATALRSLFSANLQPLTLKCLLIHSANPCEHHQDDVGWGCIAPEAELPLCPANTARVIYQGELPPKQLLRAKIPVPPGLDGMIEVSATVCYATEIRASDPLNYTNSGVEIAFRPNAKNHATNKITNKPSTYAKTARFFMQGDYASEEEKRTRDRKWETVLHASKRLTASKLHEPVFDLHFIPRLGAMDHATPEKIRYAMVISVRATKYDDMYQRVLSAFPKLQALTPITVQATV